MLDERLEKNTGQELEKRKSTDGDKILAAFSQDTSLHGVKFVFGNGISKSRSAVQAPDTAPPGGLVAVSSGVSGGMRLTLDLDAAEPEKLSSPGVKVMLHDPEEKIVMTNAQFLQLSPGTVNYISVRTKTSKFLPSPYQAFVDTECVDTGQHFRHPSVPVGKYTLRACEDNCQSEKFEKLCGCRATLESEENVCDPLRYFQCIAMIPGIIRNSTGDNAGKPCDCPIPCDEVIYEPTLSSTQIRGITASKRNNMITTHIYFDRLRIEATEQVADYTVGDIFASIGGQMGLFLGASFVTLMEVVELLARCAWRRIRGSGKHGNQSQVTAELD